MNTPREEGLAAVPENDTLKYGMSGFLNLTNIDGPFGGSEMRSGIEKVDGHLPEKNPWSW
jgi:hypothetical protein